MCKKKISWENTTIHDPFFFFFSKFAMLKKKIRSTSNENVDQFLIWKKCKSTSKEDADPFFI